MACPAGFFSNSAGKMSNISFIDFSLQCKLELKDWCFVKRRCSETDPRSFCLGEFVVSSGLRSSPQTAKKPFVFKSALSLWQADCCHFEETANYLYSSLLSLQSDNSQLVKDLSQLSWYYLILVHTELTLALRGFVPDSSETETIFTNVKIVRGSHTISLQKSQLLAPSGPSTRL